MTLRKQYRELLDLRIAVAQAELEKIERRLKVVRK